MHRKSIIYLINYSFKIDSYGYVYPNALSAAVLPVLDWSHWGKPHPAPALIDRKVDIPVNGPELLEHAVATT
jgi:hypothetical protein